MRRASPSGRRTTLTWSRFQTEIQEALVKRDGHGTWEHPFSRSGGLCIFGRCPEFGVVHRLARNGTYVLYCREHSQQARGFFDASDAA